MSRKLIILPRAEQDVDSIFEFIRERSPSGAKHWWDAFCRSAQRAASHPRQHPLAPESPLFTTELRQFLFKTRRGRTYRGVFTIVGEEVRVLRVRGPGQAPLSADELSLR